MQGARKPNRRTTHSEIGTGIVKTPKPIEVKEADFLEVFTAEITRGVTRGGSLRFREVNTAAFSVVEDFTAEELEEPP